MSAARRPRVAAPDMLALVTDPDLAAQEGRLASVLATRASQASVDSLGSTLGPAIVAATADKATAAQVAALVPAGVVQRFRADQVPEGWATSFNPGVLPTAALATNTAASSDSQGYGDAVYVAGGPNPGLWRLRNGRLQRFDIALNAPVGPEFQLPTVGSGTQRHLMEGVGVDGTLLYMPGVPSTTGTVGNRAFLFDTTTLTFTQLQSFPGTIGDPVGITRLPDGRVLLSHTFYNAAQATQSNAYFWLCDPLTNAAPAQAFTALPISGYHAQTTTALTPLPDGRVLLVGAALEADGQIGSCVLTVVGNTLTAGPAQPTGLTSVTERTALPVASGVLLTANIANAALTRSFTAAGGWVTLTSPLVTYTGGTFSGRCVRLYPGVGWLATRNVVAGGGTLQINWLFTNSPYAGTAVVDAIKL